MFQKRETPKQADASRPDTNNETEKTGASGSSPVEDAPLPAATLQAIPEGERGGPYTHLEDGRVVVLGPRVLMVLKDHQIINSGFWHEIQYASWDAETRQLTIVWVQPDRPPMMATTKSDNPQKFMKALTFRVNDTIVTSQTFTTSGGANVAVTIRRRTDGHLFSSIVTSDAISEADEKRALELERALRAELNMDE